MKNAQVCRASRRQRDTPVSTAPSKSPQALAKHTHNTHNGQEHDILIIMYITNNKRINNNNTHMYVYTEAHAGPCMVGAALVGMVYYLHK